LLIAEGVSELGEHVGERRVGLTYTLQAEVAEWEENQLFAWESRSGITNNGRRSSRR
jgi:uncharacterized membrane protein